MATTTKNTIPMTRIHDSAAKKYVTLTGGKGIDLIDATAEYLKLERRAPTRSWWFAAGDWIKDSARLRMANSI